MSDAIPLPTIFSLSKLLLAAKPKEELVSEAVGILSVGLERLGIVWDAKSFGAGLLNPKLPPELLARMEDFLKLGLRTDWELGESLVGELDELIEDIEAFNPTFADSLSKDIGKGVSLDKVEESLKPKRK